MDYKSLYFNDKVLQSSHFQGTGTCFVVSVPLFLSRFVRRYRRINSVRAPLWHS